MTAVQSAKARERWERMTPDERRVAMAPMIEAAVRRRHDAAQVLAALEALTAAGLRFKLVLAEDDDDEGEVSA